MTSHVQSVLFDRSSWTLEQASNWIKGHKGYKVKKVDPTERYYRFRQRRPNPAKYHYRLHRLENSGIVLVLGYVGPETR